MKERRTRSSGVSAITSNKTSARTAEKRNLQDRSLQRTRRIRKTLNSPRRMSSNPAASRTACTQPKGTRRIARSSTPTRTRESPRTRFCQRTFQGPGRTSARSPKRIIAALTIAQARVFGAKMGRWKRASHSSRKPSRAKTSSMKTWTRTGKVSMARAGESGNALDAHFLHHHRLARAVARIARKRRDFVGNVLPFDHFAKNCVAIIEPRSRGYGYEKLAAVRVGPRIGHGELAGLVVPQRLVEFIGELIARPAGAGAQRAAALNHEVGDHAVKRQAVVKRPFHGFSRFGVGEFLCAFGEFDEVGHRLRRFLFKQLAHDGALRGLEDGVRSRCACHVGFILSPCGAKKNNGKHYSRAMQGRSNRAAREIVLDGMVQ